MADISIPGVSDKYKTNDFIEALIKKKRLPLTREQESLDRYKEQQNAQIQKLFTHLIILSTIKFRLRLTKMQSQQLPDEKQPTAKLKLTL